jgi:hypothetical protein
VRALVVCIERAQDCPQEVVDLHNLCISERPEERPTAAELLTTLAPLL